MSLRGACEWASRPFSEWKVIPALSTELPFVGERGVEFIAAAMTVGASVFVLIALRRSGNADREKKGD